MKDVKDNLVPLSKRTKSEQRAIAAKAGKASGEARRKRKALKEYAEMVLSLSPDQKTKDELESMGIAAEDATNGLALVLATYKKAIKGDPKCINIMREMAGERIIEHKVTTNIDETVKELDAILEAESLN